MDQREDLYEATKSSVRKTLNPKSLLEDEKVLFQIAQEGRDISPHFTKMLLSRLQELREKYER